MTEETTTTTEPVKWYTFRSEKNGRDYYYEPNSKVVTWIRPDIYDNDSHNRHDNNNEQQQRRQRHIHSFVPQTPPEQQDETTTTSTTTSCPIVKRRVSFHASSSSVDNESTIIDGQRNNNEHKSRRFVRLSPFCWSWTIALTSFLIVIIFGVTTFIGWIPTSGTTLLSSVLLKEPTQQVMMDVDKEETVVVEHDTTKQSRHFTKKQWGTMNVKVQSDVESKEEANEPSTWLTDNDEQPSPEEDDEVGQPQRRHIDTGNNNHRDRVRISRPTTPTWCYVPFAHIVSKHCRKVLARQPVYDMDALLDCLI